MPPLTGELTSKSEVAVMRGLPMSPEVPPPNRGRLISMAEPVYVRTKIVLSGKGYRTDGANPTQASSSGPTHL